MVEHLYFMFYKNAMHPQPRSIVYLAPSSEKIRIEKYLTWQVLISNSLCQRPAIVYFITYFIFYLFYLSIPQSVVISHTSFIYLLLLSRVRGVYINLMPSVTRQYCSLASRWECMNVGSVSDVLECVMFTDILFNFIQSVTNKIKTDKSLL